MALRWDLSDVKNHEDLHIEEGVDRKGNKIYKMNCVTENLIFLSLQTGIGKITEENVEEVLHRLKELEDIFGPFMGDDKGYIFFTEEHVRRHIGLNTNASFKDETRASFTRRMNKIRKERKADANIHA